MNYISLTYNEIVPDGYNMAFDVIGDRNGGTLSDNGWHPLSSYEHRYDNYTLPSGLTVAEARQLAKDQMASYQLAERNRRLETKFMMLEGSTLKIRTVQATNVKNDGNQRYKDVTNAKYTQTLKSVPCR